MDVFTAIHRRLTARTVGEPGPTPDQITRILAAGVQAPDHGRLAPWRFVILEGDQRARLGDAMAALRRADPACSDEAAAFERAKAFRAPLVIVVAAHPVVHPKVPAPEQIMAVAACVQNMILAATALGYVANWKTGPAATAPTVLQALGLPPELPIIAILYIGTQLNEQQPTEAPIKGVVGRDE